MHTAVQYNSIDRRRHNHTNSTICIKFQIPPLLMMARVGLYLPVMYGSQRKHKRPHPRRPRRRRRLSRTRRRSGSLPCRFEAAPWMMMRRRRRRRGGTASSSASAGKKKRRQRRPRRRRRRRRRKSTREPCGDTALVCFAFPGGGGERGEGTLL